MTTPSATIASKPDAARRAAATDSSNAPGTRISVTSVTCESANARRAPSSRPFMTVACQRAATIATRSPLAPSTMDSCGAPCPLIDSSRLARIRVSTTRFARVDPRLRSAPSARAASRRQGSSRERSSIGLLDLEVMTHAVALGLQVAQILRVGGRWERHPADDAQAVPLESRPLGRVVAQQPHRMDAQVDENLGAGAVV